MKNFFSCFFLFLFAFLLGCSGGESQLIIYKNVKGYTFHNGGLDTFSAIAFKGNTIIDVAFDDSLETGAENAKVINGDGNVMLPGLIDAHAHIMGLGYQIMNVNVAGISSLDSTLQKVAEYAENNPELNWIRGRGWNQVIWGIGRFPTAEELDQAVSERPVWLSRVDGHAGWANSKAMEIAGITEETQAPKGGKIIRDENGNPTGVFIDAAQSLITSHIPEYTDEESRMAFKKALKKIRSKGLTSVHDAGVGVDTWNLYKQFADEDSLTVRIYAMISGTGETFDQLSKDGPDTSYANGMLAVRSVKLYADGALGSRGAALLEPYSDRPEHSGLLFYSLQEMTNMVMKAAKEGYQVNVHAIGDAANRQALNAFEAVKDSLGNQGLRFRIEHAQVVDVDDISRFKKLNIIASMQPTHATSDMNMAEDRIGKERMRGAYVWQTFLDQGTVVACGSDFPVEHVNPFFGLYSAVTRQDHQGNPPGGWYPQESITRKQALKCFTVDAAYAAHQEDIIGTLEKGKRADFIIIDRDYFEIPESEIWKIDVLETWVAGEKVYDAEKK